MTQAEAAVAVRDTAAAEPAIEVAGLVKTYGKDVRAVDGLSFAAEPGKVFGLLGPNGAGKSTTVRILTTLSIPDSGTARVAGFDVLTQAAEVRRAIGVVSQRTAIDQMATGLENLTMMARIHGLRGRELRTRVDEQVERFGLGEKAKLTPYNYSGGQRRRLDLAMGRVHRPRVLFLDEPTTGLDPEARIGLWDEIRSLTREDGLTVLLTTHYLEEADLLAHQLAIVDRGRVVASGTPASLKGDLQGDAVHIGLSCAEDAVRAAALLTDFDDVQAEDSVVHLRTADGARALPRILSTVDGCGLAVASATVNRPSLDDVYLRHTGRAFRRVSDERDGS